MPGSRGRTWSFQSNIKHFIQQLQNAPWLSHSHNHKTQDVIFATGLKPLGNDTFLVIYGGGDSDTAAIKLHVDVDVTVTGASLDHEQQ